MKTFLSIFILLSSFVSHACECGILNPLESYVDKVEYIFTGKVIELSEVIDSSQYMSVGSDNKKFYFNQRLNFKVVVIERLKTGQLHSDTLNFTSDLLSCDPRCELGKSYLFFADLFPNSKFTMAYCTPWGEIKQSEENIRKLREKQKN